MLGISFPPSGIPLLAWAALVPLLLRWNEVEQPRELLTEVYTAYLLAYALAFFWPLLTAYPQTLVLSLGGLLLIPLLLAIPFVISLPIRRRFGRASGLVAFVALHLTVEFVLQHGPIAFPWATLGQTQANLLPLAQMVAWTGVAGLSLWLLVVNILVFLAMTSTTSRVRRIGYGVLTAALIGASWSGGRWLQHQVPQPDGYVTVGLIQPGLQGEYGQDNQRERLGRLVHLSDSLVQAMGMPPELLIWPDPIQTRRSSTARPSRHVGFLQRLSDQMGSALLIGAERVASDPHRPGNRVRHNSALLVRPRQPLRRFDQVDLVPFAEHIPGSQYVPWLRQIVQPSWAHEPLAPGQKRTPLSYEGVSIGVLVGFEAILSAPARALGRQGADFLVAMTHDAWWGRVPGYRQHLAHVRLRAIASRKAVVQVTRSGSTAVIAPDGSMIHAVDPTTALSRLVAVPLNRTPTPYVRTGDWISLIALALTGVIGAWWFLVRHFPIFNPPPRPSVTAPAKA
jgi:apolipoprotein N-acyltransferase